MICPSCESNRVVPNAYMRDQGEYPDVRVGVAIQTRPDAWLLKGLVDVELRASICCDCGWIELRGEGDLEALWRAYQGTVDES